MCSGLTFRVLAGLSSDSGLGGSTDGSSDILVFGSVVEGECRFVDADIPGSRLTRPSSECEASEDSSGEAELEVEPDASDLEDGRDLRPGALLYRAARSQNLPVMAEALAHGADVNMANSEDGGRTPLIQAVVGVSPCPLPALMSL